MKLIYKGKFNGDPTSLPCGEHKPGAVKFREIDDPKKLAAFANTLAIILLVGALVLYGVRAALSGQVELHTVSLSMILSGLLSVVVCFPHELLHAICFKKEVYLYTNWKQGMLFVLGPEDMSKARFIFLSLLPNLVFGAVPYVLGMIWPNLVFCGIFGGLCLSMGAGDYYNVFNTLTQVPRGGRVYLYQFNSYWYLP